MLHTVVKSFSLLTLSLLRSWLEVLPLSTKNETVKRRLRSNPPAVSFQSLPPGGAIGQDPATTTTTTKIHATTV